MANQSAKVIAVFNIKGGVGKTTSAVNLAYLSAASGKKTLLWDMDHQGAAGFFLGIDDQLKGGLKSVVKDMQQSPQKRQLSSKVVATEYDNLDLLPADISLRLLDGELGQSRSKKTFIKKLIAPLLDDYDMIFIDCTPGLNMANESLLHAVDLVLVPVIPTILAMRTLEQLNQYLKDNMSDAPKLRAFFTLMDGRKTMHQQIYDHLCIKRKTVMLPVAIPNHSVVEKMGVRQKPLPSFAPSSPASEAYASLWQSVNRMRL